MVNDEFHLNAPCRFHGSLLKFRESFSRKASISENLLYSKLTSTVTRVYNNKYDEEDCNKLDDWKSREQRLGETFATGIREQCTTIIRGVKKRVDRRLIVDRIAILIGKDSRPLRNELPLLVDKFYDPKVC